MSVVLLRDLRLVQRCREGRGVVVLVYYPHHHPGLTPSGYHYQVELKWKDRVSSGRADDRGRGSVNDVN